MAANPAAAPSGPDVARQIAEQIDTALQARLWNGAMEELTTAEWHAIVQPYIARALADARREGLEEAKDAEHRSNLALIGFVLACGVGGGAFIVFWWLR